MGEVRRCDARCHGAEHPACACWCGGLFHGKAGESARQAFRETFAGDVPALPPQDAEGQGSLFSVTEDGRRWTLAIEAAKAARSGPSLDTPR